MSAESDAAYGASPVEGAVSDAEKSLHALTARLERIVEDAVDLARSRSKVYAENAGEQFETAQRYVGEHVRQRPLTATAAALGVGVLIGLLLSGRGR